MSKQLFRAKWPLARPMVRMRQIRFRFSPIKALAAIHWMLEVAGPLDLHMLLKACYFADKEHLNKHNRPIFGATYRAMRFGPVPLEIYEMAKGEAYWMAELKIKRFPWEICNGYEIRLNTNDSPNLDVLSQSDMEALEDGLRKSQSMTFNDRTAATHGSDWQAANLGIMRYEDMLEETPEKSERVAYLREAGRYMRL